MVDLDELKTRAIKFMQMEELKEFCSTNRVENVDRRNIGKKRMTIV